MTKLKFLLPLLLGSIAMVFANNDAHINKKIQVYGHRGARAYSPEMTLGGYRTALKIGVNWVDADIIMSKDGVILASHDLWLNPDVASFPAGKFWSKSNGDFINKISKDYSAYSSKYLAYNLTASELQKYCVGVLNPDSSYAKMFPQQVANLNAKMPTLQDVISYVKTNSDNTVNFQFEIKSTPEYPNWTASPDEFAKKLYAILKKNHIIDRVEIQAFDWRYLFALQKLDKNIKTAYLVGYTEINSMQESDPKIAGLWSGGKLLKDYNNSLPKMVKDLGGSVYGPEDVTLTKDQLDEAHKLGLKVVVWTWPEHYGKIFDPVVVNRLIDWGVDGIITDDPAHLNAMLAARGYIVPKNFPNAK